VGRYLDIALQVMAAAGGFDMNDISDEKGFRLALDALERRCPDIVNIADWQQGVVDTQRFLRTWERQVRDLGWTTADLFGLNEPPPYFGLTYPRLGRHDATGLIWSLRGRPVVALTAESAAIGMVGSGAVMFYCRKAKPGRASFA
jgi:hypothetical protein